MVWKKLNCLPALKGAKVKQVLREGREQKKESLNKGEQENIKRIKMTL